MSDLIFIERTKLEKLLRMGGGYVLDFNDRTFAEFVVESTGKNIWDAKYLYRSGSKANRLRAFWKEEPNHGVGKLIADLLDYCHDSSTDEQSLWEECHRIAERLVKDMPVQDIEAISAVSEGRAFEVIAKAVRESIERNELESGLDRLHTFVLKYVRALCETHGIEAERQKPLHSLFGEYVKHLKQQRLIESEMTEKILKSSISILEAFNRVRNEQSLAHDNPILNYDESRLIFNHVVSVIQFIRVLENRRERIDQVKDVENSDNDDLPF